jgi:hypothetical protein
MFSFDPRCHGLRADQGIANRLRRMIIGELNEHRGSCLAFDKSGDRRTLLCADDQITLRKTVRGPGGSGVAEVALRSGR